MASVGHSTKVGFGAITRQYRASGTGVQVKYDYVVTWIHGATGQFAGTNVRPKRVLDHDDEVIAAACAEGDPCMARLKPGDDAPTLYVFDEVYEVDDC